MRTSAFFSRLEKKFVAFPLRASDLLLHLPPSFSLGVLRDTLAKPFRRRRGGTFEEVLLAGLGGTIGRRFYFPYAEKLWGLPPGRLDPVQARRRISASGMGAMAARLFRSKKAPARVFHYPERGFGQIAAETAGRIRSLGGRILCSSRIRSVKAPAGGRSGTVSILAGDGAEMIPADFLFSTLPVTELVRSLRPEPPGEVLRAAGGLRYRSMVYLYLELGHRPYTTYDAHYFPGLDVAFSRMSEPLNYSCSSEPGNRTGLCFELPCGENDSLWNLPDEGVRDLVVRQLARTGLPSPDVLSYTVRRRRNVYPVYELGFDRKTGLIEGFLEKQGGLVTLGRQGLYVHDNTHHTIEMGIAAGSCLDDGLHWDGDLWLEYRKGFEGHVVVD